MKIFPLFKRDFPCALYALRIFASHHFTKTKAFFPVNHSTAEEGFLFY